MRRGREKSLMATRRRVARCWKSQVSAKAPRPRRRIALWVGVVEAEVAAEVARLGDCRKETDDADVFFLVFLRFATLRSSSRVSGGRVQRFPIAI